MHWINPFAMAPNGKRLTCTQPYFHFVFQDFQHVEKAAREPVERENGQNKETEWFLQEKDANSNDGDVPSRQLLCCHKHIRPIRPSESCSKKGS